MAEQSGEVTPSNTKQRSSVEKCLVWGGIAILAGVVFVEYRAKTAFDSALTWLSAHENSKPTIDEIRSAVGGATESKKGEEEISFNWFSLFKSNDYEIICDLQDSGGNQVMTGFYTKAGLEAAQSEINDVVLAGAGVEPTAVPEAPPIAMPTGGGGGGHDAQGSSGGPAGDESKQKKRPELEDDTTDSPSADAAQTGGAEPDEKPDEKPDEQ